MSAHATVRVFAKAPEPGACKTRLAAGIGDAAAVAFYRASLRGLAERLGAASDWSLVFSVSPDEAVIHPFFEELQITVEGQGAGDLGERMGRVLAGAAPDRPVLIVGGDVPEITPGHIARALEALCEADLVLGPSPDGGYWLIGASRPPPAGCSQRCGGPVRTR